jgi:putative Ca2+/H+ antiporter (TMEM165/GDT1 family)
LETLLVSAGVVALGEMGDKTQLLALLLAAKFKRPVPIIFGIFFATLANHALAGAVGAWIASTIGPEIVRWVIGIAFVLMAGWVLIPDKASDEPVEATTHFGVFGTTLIAFFLAEMGDKTQLATVALAARFDALTAVVIGTTLGMMLANVPAVFLGDAVSRRVSLRVVRAVAALIFVVLGVLTLFNVGNAFQPI